LVKETSSEDSYKEVRKGDISNIKANYIHSNKSSGSIHSNWHILYTQSRAQRQNGEKNSEGRKFMAEAMHSLPNTCWEHLPHHIWAKSLEHNKKNWNKISKGLNKVKSVKEISKMAQ
jgi:plasmid rolling circle replication initiator protein Rep